MIYIDQKIELLSYMNIVSPDDNLIDLHSSTVTVWDETVATEPSDGGLIVKFDNDNYTALGIGRTNAIGIRIRLYNPDDTLAWEKILGSTDRTDVRNWSGYYNNPFIKEPITIETTGYIKLPSNTIGGSKNWAEYYDGAGLANVDGSGYIEVYFKIDENNTEVEVGYLVGGHEFYIGDTLFGASQDLVLSEVKDDSGTVVWREVYEELNAELKIESKLINDIKRKMKSTLGRVVFVAEPNAGFWEHLAIFGKIENFTPSYKNRMGIFSKITVKEEL